jgi:hypothetical protein
MFLEGLTDSAVRIVEIAEEQCPIALCGAALDTGWLLPAIDAVDTEGTALCCALSAGVVGSGCVEWLVRHKAGLEGAGDHAVAAADTAVFVD